MKANFPRVVVAGLSGDSGKTLVSCGLIRAFRDKGFKVSGLKKGPDYIDPAWLKLASGDTARNLDTFLMGSEKTFSAFCRHAAGKDISFIEGNRGLFDGQDADGTHSTAELAKLLSAPVILVVNIAKVTRTAAALVLGCKMLEKDLKIAGIVLNNIAGKRHSDIAVHSIEKETGIPVLGAIPRIESENIFPSRHLGLITPGEYEAAERAVAFSAELIKKHTDLDKFFEIAKSAEELDIPDKIVSGKEILPEDKVKIGYFYDKAFSFYYQENLEALRDGGAELIEINSITEKKLPDIHTLYIGGGFPETNILELSKNTELMSDVKAKAEKGLPIYAECGGLMYLAKEIEIGGNKFALSGVLPIVIKMSVKPQGHGYTEAIADCENPFFEKGCYLKGHEFHYSIISDFQDEIRTSLKMLKGTGAKEKRDGLVYKNVFAAYTHLHSEATPEWSEGILEAARKYRNAF